MEDYGRTKVLNHTCLGFNLHGIPNLCANQRLAHRRLVGDLAAETVRLGGAYNLEFLFLVKLHVQNLYLAAHADLIQINLILYNYLGIFKNLLYLLNSR